MNIQKSTPCKIDTYIMLCGPLHMVQCKFHMLFVCLDTRFRICRRCCVEIGGPVFGNPARCNPLGALWVGSGIRHQRDFKQSVFGVNLNRSMICSDLGTCVQEGVGNITWILELLKGR